ncbi:hypothetical protein CK203_031853 [Vitis vinifera]|uniref:CCHC-type domain-containing protein n=1 Tax=Vitis vinifera TaxID=29760 RepID=A0A438IND3_VITVI|nr:hypothetical protein CK203_031853 [Vitis vinifera]
MEPHQEGASIGRPPFLTGENYSHWKVRMQYFLKMQSEKVWNAVEFGWSPPKVLDREGRPTNVIKPKLEWDRGDNEASENNARAMYSIFNAISTDEFRRIATCTSAKEAWDILQVTHEGTNAVKVSKLQMLTSRFETIRMEDHENFGEFYAKLMDIVNSSFNLGEPIPNSKVVRKILRSLPERFRAKVTAIEESKDVDSLKVDELVGSLQTFEMTLGSPRKSKGIALNAIKEESLGSEGEGNEKMSDGEVARFARKFKKYMKFRKYKKKSNEDARKWNNSMGKSNVKDKKKDKSVKKDLEVECFKCGGKGHYATECPSKKKGKKAMQVTWSDSESCQSSEKESNASEECTNFTAFMASVIDEPLKKEVLSESCESSDSNGDEMSFDSAYETLYKECLSLKQEQVEWKTSKRSLISEIKTLKGEKKSLLDKIAFLEGEHFDMKKMCDELKSENQVFKNELSLRKEESHPSSKRLSDLINLGRKSFDKRGLGFVDEATTPSSGKTIFVKSCEEVVPKKIPPKLKLHCTHCTKMGHTMDRCYARMFESFQRKLTNLMNESFTLRNRLLQGGKRVFMKDSNVPHYSGFQGSTSNGMTKVTNVKQIWVKKSELNCLVVHTALRASELHSWYFDSGCSRHMTGNRSFFTNFTEFDGGNVTFGDGNVASVKGKGTICAPGISNLEEVLYVEGLKANLISISQICDKKFNVQFSQNLCKVFDLNGNCVIIGLRTSDNCYAVCQNPSTSFSSSLVCGSSKIESIDLWHRRLGHLNYRDLMKVANNEVIKGIPKLGKPSNPICGKKPSVKYFRVFGSRCYVLKDHENLGKFESKSEEGIFLGYSSKSRAYRVYILSSKCMVESINVIVDDMGSRSRECDDDRIDVSKDIEVIEEKSEDEKLSEDEKRKMSKERK